MRPLVQLALQRRMVETPVAPRARELGVNSAGELMLTSGCSTRAGARPRGVLRTMGDLGSIDLVSLSRLNHWLPGREAHPEVVEGTTDFHHDIADALFPEADPVFHTATALHTAVDMLNPEPSTVQGLVGLLLLLCQLLSS